MHQWTQYIWPTALFMDPMTWKLEHVGKKWRFFLYSFASFVISFHPFYHTEWRWKIMPLIQSHNFMHSTHLARCLCPNAEIALVVLPLPVATDFRHILHLTKVCLTSDLSNPNHFQTTEETLLLFFDTRSSWLEEPGVSMMFVVLRYILYKTLSEWAVNQERHQVVLI